MGTPDISKLGRGEFRDLALWTKKNIIQDKKCLSYGFTDNRFMDNFQDKCGLTRPAGPNLVIIEEHVI